MSTKINKYKLLKDLPMYPAGTIVTRERDYQPSQYRDELYAASDNFYTDDGNRGTRTHATLFLEKTIIWCISSMRVDDNHEDWVVEIVE